MRLRRSSSRASPSHLSEIRSFEKLTGTGVTFLGADVVRALEVELPRRVGRRSDRLSARGEHASEEGLPRVKLVVHPRVGPGRRGTTSWRLSSTRSRRATGGEHLMGLVWRQGASVAVERRPPRVGRSGKVQHLVLEIGRARAARRCPSRTRSRAKAPSARARAPRRRAGRRGRTVACRVRRRPRPRRSRVPPRTPPPARAPPRGRGRDASRPPAAAPAAAGRGSTRRRCIRVPSPRRPRGTAGSSPCGPRRELPPRARLPRPPHPVRTSPSCGRPAETDGLTTKGSAGGSNAAPGATNRVGTVGTPAAASCSR